VDRLSDENLLQDFIDDCSLRDMTKKTIENYRSATNIFKDFLHEKNLTIISVDGVENKDILEEFHKFLIKVREVSHARVKVYFSALNCLYDYLEYNKIIKKNIVLNVRRRYVRQYKKGYKSAKRKIIEIDEMSKFLNGILNLRDKAISVVFVKTGIRRGELITIDVDDINFEEKTITLKPIFHKRSNLVVFFDEECENILRRWLKRREHIALKGEKALFVSDFGKRLKRRGVSDAVTNWAEKLGYSKSGSKKLEERFTCHCLRHCNNTYLRRNGMPIEFIKELRGDAIRESFDIYNHIDHKDLRKTYLACMPKFNVY
jgi:integrase/recombinase XerD